MNDFWFVAVPFAIVWALTMVDIFRHPATPLRRLLWILGCTLVWPVIIAWYLLRPVPGRLAQASTLTDDRRHAAVSAVLARSTGQLSGAELQQQLQQLATESGGGRHG